MRSASSLRRFVFELWWTPPATDTQPSDAFSPMRPVLWCAKQQSNDFVSAVAAANDFRFSSASLFIHCSSITANSAVRWAIRCVLMIRLQNIIFWRNFYDGITCAWLISFKWKMCAPASGAWSENSRSVFFNEFSFVAYSCEHDGACVKL